MFWFKKKCEHDWSELETGREYVDHSSCGYIDGRFEELTNLYCHKCDLRKKVDSLEGRLILKANEIKWRHKSSEFSFKR